MAEATPEEIRDVHQEWRSLVTLVLAGKTPEAVCLLREKNRIEVEEMLAAALGAYAGGIGQLGVALGWTDKRAFWAKYCVETERAWENANE